MSFPVKAVIFDWAGTMVDFGCMAPVHALMDVFAGEGVEISASEARADMGKAKHDHLTALMADAGVASRWQAAKGAAATADDIERLYQKLVPAMTEAASRRKSKSAFLIRSLAPRKPARDLVCRLPLAWLKSWAECFSIKLGPATARLSVLPCHGPSPPLRRRVRF